MIGQMSVHHVYLLNYLLSAVLVKSGQYVICLCVYELINIDIFIYSLIQFCDFNFRQYASQGQRYRRVQRRKALQPQQQERERQEEGHQ